MKNLQTKNNPNPAKIVLTGYRIIKILKMLIQEPKTVEQINTELKSDPITQKSLSNDMICLYINTLRHIGCNILRPCKSNGFKYHLVTHPFNFKITNNSSKAIAVVLESLIRSNNWKELVDVCDAFKELKELCSHDSDLSFLRIISDILKIDNDLIKKLDYFCQQERSLILEYKSTSSNNKNIKLIANKLFLENSRLYLWGYSQELEEMQYLRVDKIKGIKVVSLQKHNTAKKNTKIATYKLTGSLAKNFEPDENQTVVQQTPSTIIVQEQIHNKFKLVQKILLYADNCIFIEPRELKEEITSTLEEILEQYE